MNVNYKYILYVVNSLLDFWLSATAPQTQIQHLEMAFVPPRKVVDVYITIVYCRK